MPVNSEGRKIEGDLIKGLDSYQEDSATNVNFASVTVGGTGEVETIGLPVIWNGTDFELYSAQDIAAAKALGDSPLAGNRVLAITVGGWAGRGFNRVDVDLADDPTMTVIYRGQASITTDGITGWASVTNQDEFIAELELQGFIFVDLATEVDPTYNV
jgi:hypothetical protein